jgi:hypothetical protein
MYKKKHSLKALKTRQIRSLHKFEWGFLWLENGLLFCPSQYLKKKSDWQDDHRMFEEGFDNIFRAKIQEISFYVG